MIIRIFIDINFNMAYISTGFISSLMVFILIMQGNVSRTIPEDATSIIKDFECHTDSDCSENNNNYCNVDINLCSQCLNCSIYFRIPKKDVKCPKDVSDCSMCLDGYSEEIFFGGEKRDLCVPIDFNTILPTPEKIGSYYSWQDIGIISIIIYMLLVLWTYFYKRVWNSHLHGLPSVSLDYIENVPPSYDSCMKLNNYVTDDVQEFNLFTGEQPPINEWRHQNAVPFRRPEDSQDINNVTDQNDNLEEIDGTDMREIEDPELHDEETMPSAWTPPPPPSASTEINNFQNNTLQVCPLPFKRIRLAHQSPEEKSYQDEDNGSDISQDEF